MRCILIASLFISSSVAFEHVPPSFKDQLATYEHLYNIPTGMLSAVAWVETKHRPKSFVKHDGRSAHASYGALQIQLATAQLMGFQGHPSTLLHPETNIKYGAAYLSWLLKKYHNNYAKALTAFNAGPSSPLTKKGYSGYVALVLNAWADKH